MGTVGLEGWRPFLEVKMGTIDVRETIVDRK